MPYNPKDLPRKLRRWKLRCPICPANPGTGSWLYATEDAQIGCKTCKFARAGSRYALGKVENCGLVNLQKHAASKAHKQSTAIYLKQSDDANAAAPPIPDFKEVWDMVVSKGAAASMKGLKNVGGGMKIRKMIGCLAIGRKSKYQRFLAHATSITLIRDVADGKMALRFVAVNQKLERMTGLLGIHRMADASSEKLVTATASVLKRFCTTKSGRLLKWLERRIRRYVHCITVDAAADEVLAAEMSRRPISELLAPLFPNTIVLRDKAHSSRRILSRPWQAIGELQQLVNRWVKGKRSICQLIHHSKNFKAWFHEFICVDVHTLQALSANVRAAKHRFESFARPLARCCRQLLSVLRTAIKIAKFRHSDEAGQAMRTFLHNIKSRDVLLLGMAADASDECLLLTRFCDDQDMDLTVLGEHTASFLANILDLFGAKRSCLNRPTYTKLVYETLSNGFAWTLGNKAYSLVKPPPEDVDWCFSVMSSWLPLAAETVSAEFPGYELAQAFAVFLLDTQAPCDVDTHFRRLAMLAGVDWRQAKLEYQVFWRFAKHCFDNGKNVLESWKAAVEKGFAYAAKHPGKETCFSFDALLPILFRFFGFCPSTSGLEQGFSKTRWGFTSQQYHCSLEHEEATSLLLVDGLGFQLDDFANAQQAWEGSCRQSGSENRLSRIDTGLPKKRSSDPASSEQAFVKRLRSARLRSKRSADDVCVDIHALADSSVWGADHEKEMAFIREKQRKRLVQAVDENLLLPEETSESLMDEARDTLNKKIKAAATRSKRRRRDECSLALCLALPDASTFASKTVYLERASLQAECGVPNFRITTIVNDADIFVVEDPAKNCHSAWRWSAMLRGCYCVTASVLLKHIGISVKFKCALQTRRWLFVSAQFKAKHASAWGTIDGACNLGVSRWTFISRAQFLARRLARPTCSATLALVCTGDHLLTDHPRYTFVGPFFFDRVAVMEKAGTGSQACT